MKILTQYPVTIDLSLAAMEYVVLYMTERGPLAAVPSQPVQCELDNFCNLLHNLIERHEPAPATNNEDLL